MNSTTNKVLIAIIVITAVVLGGLVFWSQKNKNMNQTGSTNTANSPSLGAGEQRGRPPDSAPFSRENPAPVTPSPDYTIGLGDNVAMVQGVRAYKGQSVVWFNDTTETYTIANQTISPGKTYSKTYPAKGEYREEFSGKSQRAYTVVVIDYPTKPEATTSPAE